MEHTGGAKEGLTSPFLADWNARIPIPLARIERQQYSVRTRSELFPVLHRQKSGSLRFTPVGLSSDKVIRSSEWCLSSRPPKVIATHHQFRREARHLSRSS